MRGAAHFEQYFLTSVGEWGSGLLLPSEANLVLTMVTLPYLTLPYHLKIYCSGMEALDKLLMQVGYDVPIALAIMLNTFQV